MKTIKIRTKIEAAGLATLFIIMSMSTIWAQRTITPTTDTITGGTYILTGDYAYGAGSNVDFTNATVTGVGGGTYDNGTGLNLTGTDFSINNTYLHNFYVLKAALSPWGTLWNLTRSLVGSNSNAWNSSRAVIAAKGATWNSTSDVVTAKRATWNSTADVVTAKRATWNSTSDVMTAKRLNWNWTASNLNTLGALWNYTRSVVLANSNGWNSSRSVVSSNGAGWNSSRSVISGSSAGWNSSRSVIASTSGGWNSSRSVIATKGATWNSTADVVTAKRVAWNASASNLVTYGTLWNLTRTLVSVLSAGWNSSRTVIAAKGATWNSTSDVVTAKRAAWNSTSDVVTAKRADWNASASGYNVTRITNSNGKYWAVTEANLALALTDVIKGGTVWVGSDITLTSVIDFDNYDGVTLDFQNNNVTLTGNIDFINVTNCLRSNIQNVLIKIPNDHVGNIITVCCEGAYNRFNTFENIRIEDDTYDVGTGDTQRHNSTGIRLLIPATATSSLWDNTFRDIQMHHVKNGILLECHDTASWGNGNYFENIVINGCTVGINFTVDATSVNAFNRNHFNDIYIQSATYTTYGIKGISKGTNIFDNVMIDDWAVASSPQYMVQIDSSAFDTKLTMDYLDRAYFQDLGNGTQLIDDSGNFYDRSPYDYIVYKSGAYTCGQDGETGSLELKSTDSDYVINHLLYNHAAKSLYIKSGTYYINSYIGTSAFGNTTIVGESKYTTILTAASGTSFTGGMISGTNIHNDVTFKNIQFNGNGSDPGGNTRCFYYFSGSTGANITFDTCIFIGWNYDANSCAIYAGSPTTDTIKNMRIINCDFISNVIAIDLNGDADPSRVLFSDISNNYFTGCTNNIMLDYCTNCTISNNRIMSGTTGIALDDTHNCTITGNIIQATNGIDEQGAADTNIIMMNNCGMCTTPIDVNGAHTIHINSNIGTVS